MPSRTRTPTWGFWFTAEPGAALAGPRQALRSQGGGDSNARWFPAVQPSDLKMRRGWSVFRRFSDSLGILSLPWLSDWGPPRRRRASVYPAWRAQRGELSFDECLGWKRRFRRAWLSVRPPSRHHEAIPITSPGARIAARAVEIQTMRSLTKQCRKGYKGA
jgi:hypothetical protein